VNDDELAAALAGLRVEPPRGYADRLVARWRRVEGPAGPLYVAGTELGVRWVRIAEAVADSADAFAEGYRARFGAPVLPVGEGSSALDEAMAAARWDLAGLSAFERDVLAATARIPLGETRPYGWVAREIGRPRAVRAVGSALGRNPVPVLIPCHRVTRGDGSPGGYVFGPEAKAALLRAEGALL
jgi:methylated-DNA-[protein]-cysteine S-methyltransferase